MHPLLHRAGCIVPCIIVCQISHSKYQLLIQRLALFVWLFIKCWSARDSQPAKSSIFAIVFVKNAFVFAAPHLRGAAVRQPFMNAGGFCARLPYSSVKTECICNRPTWVSHTSDIKRPSCRSLDFFHSTQVGSLFSCLFSCKQSCRLADKWLISFRTSCTESKRSKE